MQIAHILSVVVFVSRLHQPHRCQSPVDWLRCLPFPPHRARRLSRVPTHRRMPAGAAEVQIAPGAQHEEVPQADGCAVERVQTIPHSCSCCILLWCTGSHCPACSTSPQVGFLGMQADRRGIKATEPCVEQGCNDDVDICFRSCDRIRHSSPPLDHLALVERVHESHRHRPEAAATALCAPHVDQPGWVSSGVG